MIAPLESRESLTKESLATLTEILETIIRRMDGTNQRFGTTCRYQLEMKFWEVVNSRRLLGLASESNKKSYMWSALKNEAIHYFKKFAKWDAEAERGKLNEIECYLAPEINLELRADYLEFMENLSSIEILACQTLTNEISVAQASQTASVSNKYIYAVRKKLLSRAARYFRSYVNEHN